MSAARNEQRESLAACDMVAVISRFFFRVSYSFPGSYFRAGSIPLTLGNLTALLKLSLSKNKLSGTMHGEDGLTDWLEYHRRARQRSTRTVYH